MPDVKYEIVEELGSIDLKNKWRLELNLISWNEKPAKYDIRKWTNGREKMSKGITLTREELIALKTLFDEEVEYLNNIDD